jgi:ribosome-associated translation inhibitor RaiA
MDQAPGNDLPVEISFREMPASDKLRDECLAQFAKLTKRHPKIISGRVVLEKPAHLRGQPKGFDVHIHVVAPHSEVVVKREAAHHPDETDPALTIRKSFEAALRQLDDQTEKRRG